jgi:uncharacterized damage-inducible protein DinB
MPDPSTDPIRVWRKLAQNNLLANQRLHQACARLTPVEFTAPRTSFFPTIRATLNHILIVDQFSVDALEGGTLGVSIFDNEEPCLTMAALTDAQVAVDQRLFRLITGLTAPALNTPVRIHRRDRVQVERLDDTLSHLFQHQTHHRGQVHAMLSGSSIAPPQLDEFIMADDAPNRMRDLALLGWTEPDLTG